MSNTFSNSLKNKLSSHRNKSTSAKSTSSSKSNSSSKHTSSSKSSNDGSSVNSNDSYINKEIIQYGLRDKTMDELKNILVAKKIVSHTPDCIRKSANSGSTSPDYRFESVHFKPKKLLNNVKDFSPKLDALLHKIKDLDNADLKKHGRKFKHFIFSDVKSPSHGVKLIASALKASGLTMVYTAELTDKHFLDAAKPDDSSYRYNSSLSLKRPTSSGRSVDSDDDDSKSSSSSASKNSQSGEPEVLKLDGNGEGSDKMYKKIEILSKEQLKKTKGDNFILLASTAVYQQPLSNAFKKSLLAMFNSRPDNVYGDDARIIIMDGGFKEGIDLFDIKYVHIFEPQTSMADQKQVIGRGTRTCGQKGLVFHPTQGWPLHVFNYDLDFNNENLGEFLLDSKTAIEYYLKSINVDFRLFTFTEELEKTCIKGAVDAELNREIHGFSISSDDEMLGGGPKRKLLKVIEKLEPEITNIPSNFPEKITHDSMKEYVRENLSDFAWRNLKMENLCGYDGPVDIKKGGGTIMKYTPTQGFVSNYFTPQIPLKGMLLWHSVGTGKTCSAIATASATFEPLGYTILWVTRTTLKNDIWKNMFDQICSEQIKNKQLNGITIPDKQGERMRLLSKSWSIRPMSYKQFSNLVLKKNKFYKDLVKKNGTEDPLRKTLLIIDEAHKLYGGGDLSSIERPDMGALHAALMKSYMTSGSDSVKLMLMTATPITQNPMELIKLINLTKMPSQQIPDDFDNFSSKYLNENGVFTNKGEDEFLDDIAGHISYLNREKDARQFSQPIVKQIKVPIINKKGKILTDAFDNINELVVQNKIEDIEKKIDNNIDFELKSYSKDKIKHFMEMCDEIEYPSKRKTCKKEIRGIIKDIAKSVKNHIKDKKTEVKVIKEEIRGLKKINPAVRKNIAQMKKHNKQIFKKTFRETPYFKMKKVCRTVENINSDMNLLTNKNESVTHAKNEVDKIKQTINNQTNDFKLVRKGYSEKLKELNKTKKQYAVNTPERKLIDKTIADFKLDVKIAGEKNRNIILRLKKTQKDLITNFKSKKTLAKNQIKRAATSAKKNLTKKINQREKELIRLEKAEAKISDIPYEFKNEFLKDLILKKEYEVNQIITDIENAPSKEELREIEREKKRAEKAAEKERKATQKLREKEEKQAAKEAEKERKATQKLREKEEKEAEKERIKAEKAAEKERLKAEKKKK